MKKFLLSLAAAAIATTSFATTTIDINKADRQIADDLLKQAPAQINKVQAGSLVQDENGLTFQIISTTDNTCGVVKYDWVNFTDEVVTVPEKIAVTEDGETTYYTVTQIGAYAFQWAGTIVELNLPETIEVIEEWAFGYLGRLRKMNIPEACKYIGPYAFYFCTDLTEVKLPQGIDCIWEACFANCTSLQSIEIPENVRVIDEIAFHHCNNLKVMNLSKNIKEIVGNPFGDCWYMEKINVDPENPVYCDIDGVVYTKDKKTIVAYPDGHGTTYDVPEGTTKIGDYAFYYAEFLEALTLPESLEEIGPGAFFCANEMKQITIPKNVREIGSGAFYKSTNMKRIDVAEGNKYYKSVGGVVYNIAGTVLVNYPCGRAGEYTIPNDVYAIADYAFAGATTLETINMPESCELVGPAAFAMCTLLKNINMKGVTTIYDQAFYYCFYLSKVVLPPTIKYLGNQVYRDDLKITEIVCLAQVPPTCDGNVFDTTYTGFDFSVLIGCGEAYRKAKYFSEFAVHEDYYSIKTECNADKGSVDVNGQGKVGYLDIWTDAEITMTPIQGESISSVKVNGVEKINDVIDGKLYIAPMEQNLIVQVVFGDGSGIESLAAEGEAVYYDLNGMRVDNPQKGLYIKVENGAVGIRKITKIAL